MSTNSSLDHYAEGREQRHTVARLSEIAVGFAIIAFAEHAER